MWLQGEEARRLMAALPRMLLDPNFEKPILLQRRELVYAVT
jgi:hypothetical protein